MKFLICPAWHRVPPFLFLQGRDPRRNGHGLNAPRLPDRDGGGPTPILAQVYADYRLSGGRRDLPASLAKLEILDCQQHFGFVGSGQHSGGRTRNRAFKRKVILRRIPFLEQLLAELRGDGRQGVGLADGLPLIPSLAVALDGLHVGAVMATAVDQVVPPTPCRRVPRCR